MQTSETRPLRIWTVYDHPSDYPHCYVARLFENGKPTTTFMVCPDLDEIRGQLLHMGLAQLARHPSDDPVIVETWI